MAHAAFQWDDPFLLSQQLTDDERAIRDAAAAYCQDKLAPRVLDAFRHEKMDTTIFREMGEAGPARPHHPRTIRRPRPELRGLRPDRPRD
jgi:glutaryl-CoA dehydrogenase